MARRLVVCLDGTWKSADDKGASNVVQLMRAVAPTGADGVDQVVFYDKGVGTGGVFDRIAGGAFGSGLEANVKDAYIFLGNNYRDGDEVYLFGFSRGAYTARSLAGFIGACGLLDRYSLGNLGAAWDIYRTPPKKRPSEQDITKLGGQKIPIRCVGVWDTVGSRGIPVRWFNFNRKRYSFHDTTLGPQVACALHAVAIDEKRAPFAPTLWQKPKGKPLGKQVVEQVWFAGAHSDVGGGLKEHGLSDLALRWMMERVEALTDLDFKPGWRDALKGQPAGVLHESRSLPLYATSYPLPFQRVIGGHDGWTRKLLPSRNKPEPGHEFINEALHASVLERLGKPAPFKGLTRLRSVVYRPKAVLAAKDKVEVVEQAGPEPRLTSSPGRPQAKRAAPRAR